MAKLSTTFTLVYLLPSVESHQEEKNQTPSLFYVNRHMQLLCQNMAKRAHDLVAQSFILLWGVPSIPKSAIIDINFGSKGIILHAYTVIYSHLWFYIMYNFNFE